MKLWNPFRPSVPRSRMEWQVCANLAQRAIEDDLARRYNLRDANGKPNIPLCEKRLAQAKDIGITPRGLDLATNEPQ